MRALVAVLLLVGTAQASVVRVIAYGSACKPGSRACTPVIDYGTGTVVRDDGRHQWVLTCGHVLNSNPHLIVVNNVNVPKLSGHVMRHSSLDVAVLKIPSRLNGDSARVVAGVLPGDAVAAIGYGGAENRQTRQFEGRVTDEKYQGGLRTADFEVRDGDSGCGLFAGENMLVGVAFGVEGGKTYFTPTDEIVTWLRGIGIPVEFAGRKYTRSDLPEWKPEAELPQDSTGEPQAASPAQAGLSAKDLSQALEKAAEAQSDAREKAVGGLGKRLDDLAGLVADLGTAVAASNSTSDDGSLLSNPVVTGLVGGATGGTGLAALWGIRALLAFRRKRKERKERKTQDPRQAKPQNEPVVTATDSTQIERLGKQVSDLQGQLKPDDRLDQVISYLKDREGDDAAMKKAIESLEGLSVNLEVQPDGTVEEHYWKDGVRLAAEGKLNVLGGPVVARGIEDYVARRRHEETGDTLRSK